LATFTEKKPSKGKKMKQENGKKQKTKTNTTFETSNEENLGSNKFSRENAKDRQ
jgi:hypothetical protein